MTVASIIMTTWLPDSEEGEKRLKIIESTVISWALNLISNDDIRMIVCDDGSSEPMFNKLKAIVNENWPRVGTSYFQQQRKGVGASLNKGVIEGTKYSDILLHMVDDWRLLKPLDLDPWIEALSNIQSIAGFRFFPHPNLSGEIHYINPGIYAMSLDRHHFAFATRPSLWHSRMFESYGMFEESVSAYECERLYNINYCTLSGPILYLALPDEWEHMGGVELGDITP